MKFKSLLSLTLLIALTVAFQNMVFAGQEKPKVEIKSLRISISPSGNWADTVNSLNNIPSKSL